MISKVQKGRNVGPLLRYLFSTPGQDGTHRDPRLVASWDGEPAQWDDLRALTDVLNETVFRAEAGPPMPFGQPGDEGVVIDRPVYHVSVSLARVDQVHGLTADPHISDAQFAEVCTDMMTRVGLHKEGPEGARWVVVRHDQEGASHAHIVATLATESGKALKPWNDYWKLGEACRDWEAKLGLRQTAPRDGAGPRRAQRGERAKAERKGWSRPTREILQEQVRAVAGVSASVEDFMCRLRGEGLLVRERTWNGQTTGYAVAIDRPSKDGSVDRIWFGGKKLAPDLSLPKIRARFAGPRLPPSPDYRPLTVDREAAWAVAANAAREAAATVRGFRDNPAAAEATARAAADFLAATARLVGGPQGRPLRDAAAGFARAGQPSPRIGPSSAGDSLRQAALLLTAARFIANEDVERLLVLNAALAVLADAIARMRETQNRLHQAKAAARASSVLSQSSTGLDDRPAWRATEYTRLMGMTL